MCLLLLPARQYRGDHNDDGFYVQKHITGTYKKLYLKKKVYSDSFADNKGNIVPASYYDIPEMLLVLVVRVTLKEEDSKINMSLKHEGIPERYMMIVLKAGNHLLINLKTIKSRITFNLSIYN